MSFLDSLFYRSSSPDLLIYDELDGEYHDFTATTTPASTLTSTTSTSASASASSSSSSAAATKDNAQETTAAAAASNGGTNQSSACCSICFEHLDLQNGACALLCGHVFHEECIQSWFRIKMSCPMCKASPRDYNTRNNRFPIVKLYSTNLAGKQQSDGSSGQDQPENANLTSDQASEFEDLKVTIKNLRHDLSNATEERDALRETLKAEYEKSQRLEERNKHLDRKCSTNDLRLHKKEEEVLKLQRRVRKLQNEVSEWKSRGTVQKYGEDLDLNRTLSDLQALGNTLEPQKKIDRLFRLCQSQHTLLKERTEEVNQARKQARVAKEAASKAQEGEEKAKEKKKYYQLLVPDFKEKLASKNRQIRALKNQLMELGIEPIGNGETDDTPMKEDHRENDSSRNNHVSAGPCTDLSSKLSAKKSLKRRRSALVGAHPEPLKRRNRVISGSASSKITSDLQSSRSLTSHDRIINSPESAHNDSPICSKSTGTNEPGSNNSDKPHEKCRHAGSNPFKTMSPDDPASGQTRENLQSDDYAEETKENKASQQIDSPVVIDCTDEHEENAESADVAFPKRLDSCFEQAW